MKWVDYQNWAMTKVPEYIRTYDAAYLDMLHMGLIGEVGELVDMLKKHWYHDHPLDLVELTHELGDIVWYCHDVDPLPDHEPIPCVNPTELARLAAKDDAVGVLKQVMDICEFYDLSWDDVLVANKAKLDKRYPRGFDKERSINRE